MVKMGIYCDVVADVSLGTSTAKTKLSGDLSGNAADYTLPANAKGILYVQPMHYVVTPTATQTSVASLKVESDDLGLKDYEVFAPPIGGAIATTDNTLSDLMRTSIYPVMFRCAGGEKISLYGIPQTANTAAPYMGASIWWTDDARQITDLPFRARIGGTPGAAGSGTSTGTSAGSVTGQTITVSGGDTRTLRSLTGILAPTTINAVKPTTGYFTYSSPELAFLQRMQAEPIQGSLGSALAFAHLSRVDNLSVPFKTPTSISTSLVLSQAPTTAGNFYNGILYN